MTRITWEDVFLKTDEMVRFTANRPDSIQYVYGVPRGGIPIAVLVAEKTGYTMIEDPIGFDPKHVWVVDDIIDSGKTMLHYQRLGYLFTALYTKAAHEEYEWYEFPWERMVLERPIEDALIRIFEYIGADLDGIDDMMGRLKKIKEKKI